MTRLTIYIAKRIIISILAVTLVVMSLEFFVSFISQVADIGKQDYTFAKSLLFSICQVPLQLYIIFPMVGFLGGLLALDRLALDSELVVMRSVGYSKFRVSLAVMLGALMVLVLVTVMGEVLAPRSVAFAEKVRQIALHSRSQLPSDAWLKYDNRIVNIAKVKSAAEIADVTIFDFYPSHRLKRAAFAKYGRLESGRWVLSDVNILDLQTKQLRQLHTRSMPLGLYFSPSISTKARGEAMTQSVWSIWRVIGYLKEVGLSSREYQFQFWTRVFRPFSIVLMIALGVPFAFGQVRQASRGRRVALGVMLGFAFYMLNQIFGPLTLILQISPFFAAAAPSLLFAALYVLMMRRVK